MGVLEHPLTRNILPVGVVALLPLAVMGQQVRPMLEVMGVQELHLQFQAAALLMPVVVVALFCKILQLEVQEVLVVEVMGLHIILLL
jgi:hypothetical protein